MVLTELSLISNNYHFNTKILSQIQDLLVEAGLERVGLRSSTMVPGEPSVTICGI